MSTTRNYPVSLAAVILMAILFTLSLAGCTPDEEGVPSSTKSMVAPDDDTVDDDADDDTTDDDVDDDTIDDDADDDTTDDDVDDDTVDDDTTDDDTVDDDADDDVTCDGCLIDGICYDAGTINAVNECVSCDPLSATDAWTPRVDGTICDDGEFSTGADTCQSGS